MLLKLEIDRVEAVQELALLLRPGGQGAGEVIATLKLDGGRTQMVRLGRDFALDGEFVEQLANVDGLTIGEFKAKRRPERMPRPAYPRGQTSEEPREGKWCVKTRRSRAQPHH